MAKLKLKKILHRPDEEKILKNFSKQNNISFEIFENNIKIFDSNPNNKDLKFRVELLIDEIAYSYIMMEQNDPNIVILVEYFVRNEIEKKQLAIEILDKYKELSIFYNISERMTFTSDIEQISRDAFEQARKYVSSSYCLLLMRDEKNSALENIFELKEFHKTQKLKAKSSLLKKVMDEGIFDIINDIDNSPYKSSCVKIKSLICAPIMIKSYIYGVLVIGHHEKANYNSGDLKLISAIAFLLGVSIENSKLYFTLEDTFFQTVKALSETIEKRDKYTGGHVQRVTEYSLLIGEAMGLTRDELSKLRLAALMHDIGKIGIEDSILRKSYNLSDEEFLVMKKHTVYGSEIIQNIKHLWVIIPGVRGHHERFDGKGYPDGLVGHNIALAGRIIAVADTFDAMITDRPYRKGLSIKVALCELEKHAGKQFDPEVVQAFINSLKINKTI